MAKTTNRSPAVPETVLVQVVVSHDELRAGERGEVPLTDRVRALLDNGYLKLVDGFGQYGAEEPAPRLGASSAGVAPPQGPLVLLGVDAPAGADAASPR